MQSELTFQRNNEAMISIGITNLTISSSRKEADLQDDRIARETHLRSSLEVMPYNVEML